MSANKHAKFLALIATGVVCLLAIGMYLSLLQYQNNAALHQTGTLLIQTLSVTERTPKVDQALLHGFSAQPDFAYGRVTDGSALALHPSIGNEHLLPTESVDTTGVTEITLSDGRPVLLIQHTTTANTFQLGLFQAPFLQFDSGVVLLALPCLLLCGCFLWLRGRALAPLEALQQQLASHAGDALSLDSEDPAEMAEAVQTYLTQSQSRINETEAAHTKLVTQEKFLTYRAERYEAILQTLPDGIIILDEDYKVAFVNQHVESMFGIQRVDVLSETVEAWCRFEPLLEYVRNLRRDNQAALATVHQIPDPKHTNKTLGISTHALYFSRSPTTNSGLLLLMRDISQEVAARKSRAEFVGSVSHEVKAPLNTIGLYAQMISEHHDDAAFLVEAQNTIEQEVQRMTRLIHNLLSMTQIEMGTFELEQQRTQLAEMVQDCISMLDHGSNQERINVIISDNLPAVHVDKELLRIAVSNLMTNALKYSPPSKPVVVQISETAEAVNISVSDQGPGIPEADQEKIFDKFFRSENHAQSDTPGHGLGLSIAREIVNLHHGSLTLNSTLGEGTTFTIELWKNTGIAAHAI